MGLAEQPAPVPRSKVSPPAVPRGLIPRSRLDDLLGDEAAWERAPVLSVCAGAGTGKTTLLSAWASPRGDVAWLTLDAHDNDPVAVWSALLAAVGRSQIASDLPALQDLRVPRVVPDSGFVHEVIAAFDTLPSRAWLVLDDIHEVTAAAALDTIDLLLRLRPEPLRIVLASRLDPSLPTLQSLRLHDLIRDIRADDLRFVVDEAAALLAGYDIELERADLDRLLQRVEGWAAGLRLAGIALADTPDRRAAIRDFSGDARAVADYLVHAILSRLSPDQRDFLLRISVCQQVSADLAVELTGRGDAGAYLERLDRADALVTVEGRTRRWYRFHALLRGYLLAELERVDRTEARFLHRRAAGYFSRTGQPPLALEHAVAAGDEELVVELFGKHGLALVLDGRGALLRDLLAALPPRVVIDNAATVLVHAAAALDDGNPTAAELALKTDAVAQATGRNRELAAALTLWAHRLAGDVSPGLSPLAAAAAPDSDDPDVAVLAIANRGAARLWLGEVDDAEHDLRRADALATSMGRDYLAVECQSLLCVVASDRGDLPLMRERLAQAKAFAGPRGWEHTVHAGWIHMLSAWSAAHLLDFESARRSLDTVLRITHGQIDPNVALATYLLGAVVDFATTPDRREALRTFRRMWDDHGEGPRTRSIAAYGAMFELRMCVQLGEALWGREALDRVRTLLPGTAEVAVAEGMAAAAAGQLDHARAALAPLEDQSAPIIVRTTHVDAALLTATIEHRSGRDTHAFEALTAAVERAAELGSMLGMYTEGPIIYELLVQHAGRFGRNNDFADTVRRRIEEGRDPMHEPSVPFTPAELATLAELASLHTISEIADARGVSPNTVKTHVSSIYGKLGVSSRRDAVAAAHRLGLL